MTDLTLGDYTLDNGLAGLKTACNEIWVCSAAPSDYASAVSNQLGTKSFGAGNAFDTVGAGTPAGRAISSIAITDGTITTAGTVACWAAVDSSGSALLAQGALSGGGSVTATQQWTLDAFSIHLNGTPGGYTPQGVNFDGATWLAGPSTNMGMSAGELLLVSFWFNMVGATGDSAGNTFFAMKDVSANGELVFSRWDNNTIRIYGRTGGTVLIELDSHTGTWTTSSGWTHLAVAWNIGTGVFQMYINGVANGDSYPGSPANIPFNTVAENAVASFASGGAVGTLYGDLADLYVNVAETLDLSVAGNLQKFINGGNAVDLGADGSLPTGNPPVIFFKGGAAGWASNSGSGTGTWSVGGSGLTNSSTNPP